MTLDDAIWSYAEEFSDDLLRGVSDKSVEPVLEEIAETMSKNNVQNSRGLAYKIWLSCLFLLWTREFC